MLVFVGICLVLWLIGGGIPYGYDGIEIYFTYLVGYNAATFPHVNPLMADIVASPEPAAHPYYYTHHPNLFSHLLSQLLIRLGIADLRWHGLVAIGRGSGIFRGMRAIAGSTDRSTLASSLPPSGGGATDSNASSSFHAPVDIDISN